MSLQVVKRFVLISVLGFAFWIGPNQPFAQVGRGEVSGQERTREQAANYDRCLERARLDPEGAYAEGLSWYEAGGALPARHCVAVALVNLGDYEEAAARLGRLADEVGEARPGMRYDLLAQAAQAWNLAGHLQRAETIQTRLLEVRPSDTQLRIDRALVRLSAGRTWEAVDDLNLALEAQPDDPEILLYRAAAYRYLDAIDLARVDVERALAVDPDRAEAWLEAGILFEMEGAKDLALQAWGEVLRLSPTGPAAAAARARIEALSVTVAE